MTNSMLCFGGNTNPGKHSMQYIANCRKYIYKMISIVKPKVIFSFGNLGCRNVSSIFLQQDRKQTSKIKGALQELASNSSFERKMAGISKRFIHGMGVNFDSMTILILAALPTG
jgi:hypothetical protein